MKDPKEEKFKVVCKSNQILAKDLFVFTGASKFLKAIGFDEVKFCQTN
jgi:hypothetical protein